MTGTMRLAVDTDAIPAATAVREAAQAAPALLVLTGQMLGDLAGQLGSADAAVRFLVDLAGEIDRPLGVNVGTGQDTLSTVFISPRGWTDQRLQGWISGHHAELAAGFGDIVRMGPAR